MIQKAVLLHHVFFIGPLLIQNEVMLLQMTLNLQILFKFLVRPTGGAFNAPATP